MNLDRESGAEAHALHTLRDVEGVRRGEVPRLREVRRFTLRFGFMSTEPFKKQQVTLDTPALGRSAEFIPPGPRRLNAAAD